MKLEKGESMTVTQTANAPYQSGFAGSNQGFAQNNQFGQDTTAILNQGFNQTTIPSFSQGSPQSFNQGNQQFFNQSSQQLLNQGTTIQQPQLTSFEYAIESTSTNLQPGMMGDLSTGLNQGFTSVNQQPLASNLLQGGRTQISQPGTNIQSSLQEGSSH